MFMKNLKYYRMKKSFSQKELAKKISVTPMAISNYEQGLRIPDMDIIKRLATALEVSVGDLMSARKENFVVVHNEFRKNNSLSKKDQEFVKESAEEYFNRFETIVEILGEKVLSDAPKCYKLVLSEDAEIDAAILRAHLGFAKTGPIRNLIDHLENKGFLIYICDLNNVNFSGINGFVNDRPYIMVNKNMTAERMRSTIVHELAHLMFNWNDSSFLEQEVETHATAISGAFLFPKEDAIRELGVHRSAITGDMIRTAKEYGISMQLLAKRAQRLFIIRDSAYRSFCITVSSLGWRKNEPSRIDAEVTSLFEQLVYRAVSEEEISIPRGAELLKSSYCEVLKNCSFEGNCE